MLPISATGLPLMGLLDFCVCDGMGGESDGE